MTVLYALAEMFLGIPAPTRCEHCWKYRTRKPERMAAHIWFNHAGDEFQAARLRYRREHPEQFNADGCYTGGEA